jgi:hypothetical protein
MAPSAPTLPTAVVSSPIGDTEGAAADFAAASRISSKVAEEYTALGVRP